MPWKNWYQKPRENSRNLTHESPKQYVKFNCGCNESQKLPLSLYALLFSTGFVEIKWRILSRTGKRGSGKNFLRIWPFEKLSTWLLSSGQEFDEKFLDSKYVLKMYFKPSRKNENFVFLPDPILPVWLKILHLIRSSTYGKRNIFEIPPCGSHFFKIHFTY